MQIRLDFESTEPIYEQLKNQIIAGIAKRELVPGERLPSVRILAADIGINMHTVNKSYKQLTQEGFILSHRQRGVVIHPDGTKQADEIFFKKLNDSLHPLIAESICRGLNEEAFLRICKDVFKDFNESKEGNK